MLESLSSISALLLMGLAAYAVGRPLSRLPWLEESDSFSRAVWSVALGLVAWGVSLSALGFLGLLHAPLIAGLTIVAAFWVVGDLSRQRLIQRTRHLFHPADRLVVEYDELSLWSICAGRSAAAWPAAFLVLACLAIATFTLVTALRPPTDGDALCYHLELPKRFLIEGRIVFLEDTDNSTYPLLTEMWFLWALALDGGVAAQLTHWGLGVLLAAATVALARPVLGRTWSEVAGCFVLLTPCVANQMTAPLNDVALAAFGALAVAAWRSAMRDEPRRWRFALAGVMLGSTLAIKYVAILLLAALVVVSAPRFIRRSSWRKLAAAAVVATLFALVVAAPWYARAAWHRGNPIYPYFGGYLAQGGDKHDTLPEHKAWLGRGPWAIVAAPWAVTLLPERFGGRGHELGPLFLALLPGLFWARRLRGLAWFVALAAVYLVGWCLLRQNVRFLAPVVAVLAVPLTWVVAESRRFGPGPRLIASMAVAAVVVLQVGRAARHAQAALPVASGWMSREDYLAEHEPTYLAAALSEDMGQHAHVLNQDHRSYYFDARVSRELLYRKRTRYDELVHAPGDLTRILRRDGFTHVLVAEPETTARVPIDTTLARLVAKEVEMGGPRRPICMHDYIATDGEGDTRRYRLYWLR